MERIVHYQGKKMILRDDDPRLSDLKKQLSDSEKSEEFFVKDRKGKVRPLKDSDSLKEGEEVISHPKIRKAANSRIEEEVNFLKKTYQRGKCRISSKAVKIGSAQFVAIEIQGIPLNPDKYDTQRGTSTTKVLFLVPTDYPKYPPVGLYTNLPHKTKSESDHHATWRAHYGAPQLEEKGWYWYCAGFGPEFSAGSSGLPAWRPHPTNFEKGHNLIKLYNVAYTSLNTGDLFDAV